MPISKIKKAVDIVNQYGLGFCLYRAKYSLVKKTGLLKKKFPDQPWSEIKLDDWLQSSFKGDLEKFLKSQQNNQRNFFINQTNISNINIAYQDLIKEQADKILDHQFCFFFNTYHTLGNPPDWFLNPVTQRRANDQQHWCDTDFFDPALGDIKFIWEPSRFAWTYSLIRAYAATGDEKYLERFWELFEHWLQENQPNIGPNYSCGQECSIRLMAMCFAYFHLKNHSLTTDERLKKLLLAIVVHTDRIYHNIDFAISTRTNHSIIEAAGIYMVGLCFPEFQKSELWHKQGKTILKQEILKQLYPDGSYIQHSMNYHRLMLQGILWSLILSEINEDAFGQEVHQRVESSLEFLYEMVDPNQGYVPIYGANDGALIIPLNTCDYRDYRPVIQLGYTFFKEKSAYDKGLWDEDILWLLGPKEQPGIIPTQRGNKQYSHGGYYTLGSSDSWAMIRCHSFKDRPSHADMLHFDLWWKGLNILRDAGTYMYNCDQPWQNYFGSTKAHNTVVVDEQSQMRKSGHFMWFDWVKSELEQYHVFPESRAVYFQGCHHGYAAKGIIHRRSVAHFDQKTWIVVDDLLGVGEHHVELNWHLLDMKSQHSDHKLDIETPHGPIQMITLSSADDLQHHFISGDEKKPFGWCSTYYGDRIAMPVFSSETNATLPLRCITILSLGEAGMTAEFNHELLSVFDQGDIRRFECHLGELTNSPSMVINKIITNSNEIDFKK